MPRFMYLLVIAASAVLAAGTPTAAGGTGPDDRATHVLGSIAIAEKTASVRPDDRANRGPGVFASDTSRDVVRPDDRSQRGPGPAPTVEIVEPPSVRVDRFDWADAAIGAAAAFGIGLLLAAASALVLGRQRVAGLS